MHDPAFGLTDKYVPIHSFTPTLLSDSSHIQIPIRLPGNFTPEPGGIVATLPAATRNMSAEGEETNSMRLDVRF